MDLAGSYNVNFREAAFDLNPEMNAILDKFNAKFAELTKDVILQANPQGFFWGLVDQHSDMDDKEIEELKGLTASAVDELLNFKDIFIDDKGIRGLTDAGWSWGVAFTYLWDGSGLYIDDRDGGADGVIKLNSKAKAKLNELQRDYKKLVGKPVVVSITEGFLWL